MTVEQIKAVLAEDFKETNEQIYDIYLLPPGEDPETCQSYLRMRNKEGKYCLIFEVCFNFCFNFCFNESERFFYQDFFCTLNMEYHKGLTWLCGKLACRRV